jgi:hypothetical protein
VGGKEQLEGDILAKEEWKKHRPSDQQQQEIHEVLNEAIKTEELNRAIKRLKKNKTPGEDLIANEVFMAMNTEERQKLLKNLEKCRVNNKFQPGWKETELKWIYKKADPSE